MLTIKEYIKNLFQKSDILFTNSGRAALQAAIEDLKLENSHILLQSFICSDVFSPLLIQNNIKAILIDSPKTSFNITFNNIKKAYDLDKKKPKALILVHTFGVINKDIDKISKWCEKNKIILIEDCAHCINIKYKNKQIGSFGDASIFSFSKITNFFLGGAYVKNKEKIKIKSKKYKFNQLDLARLSYKLPFRNFILKILRIFKIFKKKQETQAKTKIEIYSPPRIFNSFKISDQFNIEKRKKKASAIYNELKKHYNLQKFEFEYNFFHSIPILVENRDKIFNILNRKFKCEKLWTAPFNSPNANKFSKKIINIII